MLQAPPATPSQVEAIPQPLAWRRVLCILTTASFAALVLSYFWLVDAYGLNTIWVDQWSDLGLIQHAYSGHLSFSTVWAQHTDNRLLFPNLVVLLLAKTTHFNVVDEEFLSAITLVGATALVIIGHRRRTPATPWLFYLPVAIVMLSFVQSSDALWGFQFAWYLVLLALCVALVWCDNPAWNWLTIVGAILAAIVGSYSSLQGLLIWPAGLVVLLLRARPLRFILAWIAMGALTTAVYFVNYNSQHGGNANGYVLHHPLQGLRFFFFSVGNVMDSHNGNLPVALGILIVLTALWLTFSAVSRPQEGDGSALGVGLICFGLLFTAIITVGRAAAGLNAGGASRYTTFDLLTLVGCYLLILSRRTRAVRSRRFDGMLWYGSVVTVGVAVCLTLILGTINGLDDAGAWQNAQIRASRVIASIENAPDTMIERDLVVNPYYLSQTRRLAAFAREDKLAFFDSPSTLQSYANDGLPYDAHSLVATVIRPRDGTALRGVDVLLADAQSDFGIRTVVFVITGSPGTSVRVQATDSQLGWIAELDSTRVPDGQYQIESIAYDYGKGQVQSKPVAVRVKND